MLAVERLNAGYKKKQVLHNIDLTFSTGKFTTLMGANGCGKTTLLHAISGLITPLNGSIALNDEVLSTLSRKQIAKRLALLPQVATNPAGLTARELIMQGRFPWQSWWKQWSDADENAVSDAVRVTGVNDYLDTPLEQLSGGQRQRCWIAMTLAQDTSVLLLDEPTTYLDVAHQVELMNLISSLKHQGKTIIAVLHDLNQAATYSDHLVMMKQGQVFTEGAVDAVFTKENLEAVFGLNAHIIRDPHNGNPIALPVVDMSGDERIVKHDELNRIESVS
ncbi:ABC transporter ATP-binding protein [Marinomonas mediterranea]|uniref:ABC transporter ATP-binding protein n=1 Tax=Marinomonas mediterranea TaxID=119864 RepID=UPI00234B7D8B|nr:ABC transporter ATP-binding protein [Marinomonas mediterranea]WCN08299.1 ATP-binding cassette domain-containing protein [Marinomonas mediterranea]WCN12357.1 ATP-binding cassette domain-containing protein [Marinomonas mediterranea]